jgi:guanylyl transferase CofC like protein
VAEIANRYGVSTLADSSLNLNGALEEARSTIAAYHANLEGLLIMPIDLPLCSAESLSSVVAKPSDVVIVPDESGMGTNVLFLRQAAAQRFQFRFGKNSYQAHCDLAKAADLTLQTVRDDALSRCRPARAPMAMVASCASIASKKAQTSEVSDRSYFSSEICLSRTTFRPEMPSITTAFPA